MNKETSYQKIFFELNKKTITIFAVLFLVVNCVLQYKFFPAFTNPGGNGDENGYKVLVESIHGFNLEFFSNLNAQPFAFVCYLFNKIFHDARFTIRFVSLISSIITVGFLFFYYKKYKFFEIVKGNNFLNNLIVFNVLFASFYILESHFVGTSDVFSVAFGLPGFILLTENLLNKKNHSALLIGFLFAISFTSRPTFLIVLLAFFISVFLFYFKKIISKKLIFAGIFFIVFTGIINYSPLFNKGKIVLDVKEVPKETGTSWFEMNYLMAKKWDAGEIPRTQWLSHLDVIKFKKENPNFVFPKNHLDIMINDTGLFSRQMLRMMVVSIYSSFRYLLFLFPFLILFYFFKKSDVIALETKKVYFTVCFYVTALTLFMASAFKLMEFRWMYIPIVFYAFYALHFSKGLSSEKRIVLFNLVFLSGIGFFILKMLK